MLSFFNGMQFGEFETQFDLAISDLDAQYFIGKVLIRVLYGNNLCCDTNGDFFGRSAVDIKTNRRVDFI